MKENDINNHCHLLGSLKQTGTETQDNFTLLLISKLSLKAILNKRPKINRFKLPSQYKTRYSRYNQVNIHLNNCNTLQQ